MVYVVVSYERFMSELFMKHFAINRRAVGQVFMKAFLNIQVILVMKGCYLQKTEATL